MSNCFSYFEKYIQVLLKSMCTMFKLISHFIIRFGLLDIMQLGTSPWNIGIIIIPNKIVEFFMRLKRQIL